MNILGLISQLIGIKTLRLTDASIARNLQDELDAEAAGLTSSAARPSPRPGFTIGRSARPSGAPRQSSVASAATPSARSKRRRSDRPPLSADPIPEDYAAPGFRYPPQGGIRPCYLSLLRWWIRHS